jgi:hypothetical protein
MRGTALAVLVATLAVAAPASAAEPPPGDIKNMEFITNLPEGRQATAINFMTYGHGSKAREIMLITGRFGLKTYDFSNPEAPVLLGELGNDKLVLQYDLDLGRTPSASRTYWQNEDMDVDHRRKLAFLSRDPRAYGGSTNSNTDVAGVYIVDVKDPAKPTIITFKQLPTGHTTSCVNECDALWTGGPASNAQQRTELGWAGGRPIIVTDLTDPANPVSYPDKPVDLFRQDGRTAYAHDVDVDATGVAWVSGLGGMRGYWTDGVHHDPLTGKVRRATALDPIPYAGGGLGDDAVSTENPGGWMHNGLRPAGKDLKHGPALGQGYKPGELVMGTEEWFNSSLCDGEGQFVISSLEGSYDGEGWRSTPEKPFRLKTVGTWTVKDKEATVPSNSCSAHYFDLANGLIAYGWYGQGTRILDINDPTEPTQVGYFRPNGGNVWASYWYGDYVIVADNARGIDILKFGGKRKEVVAPKMSQAQQSFLANLDRKLAPDAELGWLCPLPVN